jgi:hypothetical protein
MIKIIRHYDQDYDQGESVTLSPYSAMSNNSEDDDFVFKPATSPKSNESKSSINESTNETIKSIQTPLKSTQSHGSPNGESTHNVQANNMRLSFLDDLIKEKKKEMDFELNKLAKTRFEEFLEKEKAADKEREEEFQIQKEVAEGEISFKKKNENNFNSFKTLDEKEEEMFKEMKLKAQETWKELKSEYQKSLEQLHIEQAARLSQELQLQESLHASGSVFDRDLFEKVVEKCGKGRRTAFGKEKMARFWEVLDKSYPKTITGVASPNKLDDDKLLASLLGL